MAQNQLQPQAARALKSIVRDADLLADKRKRLEEQRREDRRDYALNREFYKGNQWSWWNHTLERVDSLDSTNDANNARHKVRLVSNQIMPGVQQVVAQLTKTRPVIHATPNSSNERDMKAAELAEALYDYWWTQFNLKSKLQAALTHAQLAQGYWKITWDALAGKPMQFMLGPDGQPVTNPELADAYRDELEQMAEQNGLDPEQIIGQFQKTVLMGEIRVEAMSAEQVLVDPTATTFEDAAYAICVHAMDPDEVKARWGVSVDPNSIPRETNISFPMRTKMDQQDEEIVKSTRDVYIGYFRPTPALPKGRYVVWIESPNKILSESDWPYPFQELPLVKWPGILNPETGKDEPRTTQARGLNKELNRSISQVVMHKNLTLKPQIVAPVGSLRQRITDEPGAVFEYQPIAGLAPDWRPIPNLPSYVFEHIQDIQRRIDRIYNAVPSERTQLPPRVDAGYTVELLQEAVADQLSPEIQRIEEGLVRAGHIMASLAQKYYIEPRLLKIRGTGGSTQVKKFMNTDINGGFGFTAEAGSGLPTSRVARLLQIKELVGMQALSPTEALPYLGVSNLKGLSDQMAADEDHAYREIEKLIRGIPINPQEAQNAMQAVQSGQPNPQTGQPFASQEEAMAFVQQAMLQPLPYENMVVHASVLQKYMTSPDFEKLGPDIQGRMLQHFMLTQQAINSQPQTPPMQPVRTTLSLKGTVGPTVAAEILQRSGVPAAQPQQFLEPPLETSVYDSIDQLDMDDAGNDPLTQDEKLQAMQQAEEQHAMNSAKTAHEVALAHQRLAHTEDMHQAQMQRDAQNHAQAQAQSDAAHQERIRASQEKSKQKPPARKAA